MLRCQDLDVPADAAIAALRDVLALSGQRSFVYSTASTGSSNVAPRDALYIHYDPWCHCDSLCLINLSSVYSHSSVQSTRFEPSHVFG
jgi:hypothetical protein